MTTKAKANIDTKLTAELEHSIIYDTVLAQFQELKSKGWSFFVVDQRCGRCYFADKTITIPAWAQKKDHQYRTWYLCHEMSHAIAGWKAKHGPEFQAVLLRICPKDCVHYEVTYKPKHLAMAMILDGGFFPDDL